jgi:phospholipid/cholesterol/gamma-HCH transport system permease protein
VKAALNAIEKFGELSLYYMDQAGRMLLLLLRSLAAIARPPYDLRALLKQIYFIGARSSFVILVAGTFTGMILALQFYNTLDRFGSMELLGSTTALALVRELGPVLAALMVIARAGSAITAEIGIMRTSEQIDALECMGIDPHKFLIAPKIVAGVISVPLLTSIFNVVGIIGGYLVGVVAFGLSQGDYFESMYAGVEWNDVAMGFYKSILFGLVVTWLTAAKGFYLHLERGGAYGAEGVSRVTTSAVVLAAIAVLFGDYVIGAIML